MTYSNVKKGMDVKLISMTTIPAQALQDGTISPLTIALPGMCVRVTGKNPVKPDSQWNVETAEGLRFAVYSSQIQSR